MRSGRAGLARRRARAGWHGWPAAARARRTIRVGQLRISRFRIIRYRANSGKRASLRLLAAVEYLVVGRPLVEIREHRLRLRRYVRGFVILPHECPDGIEGVEPHEGHELNVVVSLTPDQVNRAEPWNASCFDARDHFSAHNALVRVGVVLRRPASPHAADHEQELMHGSIPVTRRAVPGAAGREL